MSSSFEPLELGFLASLAEREPRLEPVALWAATLPPDFRLQLSAAAEHLASVSAVLVEPFLLAARTTLACFGPIGFERWWQMGLALARHARASRAAEYFFTLEPSVFGAGGLDAAETWCTLGQRVSERSRHLGATYFAKTLPVLAADGGSERLRAWTEASLALLDREGWQAQLIVELSFANAPGSVLATRAPRHWYELALVLAPAIELQRFIASTPLRLSELSVADQTQLLRAIRAAAQHDATAALQIYSSLPATLSSLTTDSRTALLDLITALTTEKKPAPIPTHSAALKPRPAQLASLGDLEDVPLSPWDEARGATDVSLTSSVELEVPATHTAAEVDANRDALRALAAGLADLERDMRAVSELKLLAALRALLAVAHAFPEAAVAALLVLPEMLRHADAAQVTRWVEQGLAIGHERPAAASAYFALASRSSRAALLAAASGVALEPELGVWRKLLEMASGDPAVIRRTTVLSLRPSLEREPALGEVELPELSDFLANRDDNRAVLRFLTMQLAGRRQFGTYSRALPQLKAAAPQLFLVAEGIRIQQRIATAYPGTVDETQQLAAKLLEAWRTDEPATFCRACDALLVFALAQPADAALPAWLPDALARDFLSLIATLREPEATVLTSAAVAEQLALLVEAGLQLTVSGPSATVQALMPDEASAALQRDVRAAGSGSGSGEPISLNETTASQHAPGQAGFTAQGAEIAASDETGTDHTPPQHTVAARRAQLQGLQSFVYDEWDHTIADYRAQHCRVQELPLTADSGVFFENTLHEARDLLSHVKRQFEQLRPERYRPLFGLEDGEDFDLNALTDARIAARAGRTPNTRIYTSRTRQARDVATLFLIDISASTGQTGNGRRIIDTLKETLVVMTAALEKLGDQYAIYGFSSRGRERVEVYPVKAFREPLDHHTKARIGGMEPKSGTRMGAALRHMIPKFAAVNARSKHLILLSDGFPQDHDYGADRRTHTYGIEDTAVALREVSAAGPLPFCVTVDRSGNDYLRLMCDPAQYLIIDDIAELPRELPKIYRRVARE